VAILALDKISIISAYQKILRRFKELIKRADSPPLSNKTFGTSFSVVPLTFGTAENIHKLHIGPKKVPDEQGIPFLHIT